MTLLPMENRESILCALKCFEKDKPGTIPLVLEDYIKQIARNGQTMLPWLHLKPLILHKFNKVVDNFINETATTEVLSVPSVYNELRQRVNCALKRFDGIPFTIQRICELFENPFRHYNRPEKFLRGLEKVCMVVTTVDPQGNKIHSEDPRFPSHAGLSDCDSAVDSSLQSPPNSPTVDDLHRQQTSKSSDDDDMTDDENDEDNHTETSSHASSTSPIDSVPLCQPPVLTNPPACNAWPFGTNCDSSSSNVLSVSGVDVPNDEVGKPHLVSSQLMTEDDSALSGGLSNHVQTDAVTNDLKEPSIDDGATQGIDDVIKTDSDSDSNETGSPIPPNLRPIGQLEAFVQNVGVDTLSPSGILIENKNLDSNLIPTQIMDDVDGNRLDNRNSANTEIVEVNVVVGTKRRASSPPVVELVDTANLHSHESADEWDTGLTELQQSPAKRRRLAESAPKSLEPKGTPICSPGNPVATHLNDSPPIIVCTPGDNIRNQMTPTETTAVDSNANDVTDGPSPDPTESDSPFVGSLETGDHIEGAPQNEPSSQPSPSASDDAVSPGHHIDAETGEQVTNDQHTQVQ